MLGRAPGMDLGPLGVTQRPPLAPRKEECSVCWSCRATERGTSHQGKWGALHGWHFSSVPGKMSPVLPKGLLVGWGEWGGGGALGHRAQPFHADQAGRSKASQHPLCAPHLASVSTVTPHDGMVLINFTSADSEAKQGQET